MQVDAEFLEELLELCGKTYLTVFPLCILLAVAERLDAFAPGAEGPVGAGTFGLLVETVVIELKLEPIVRKETYRQTQLHGQQAAERHPARWAP